MVRNHHPVLIGPRFTLEYNGRFMFFGPASYYFQTPFMLLGNFDPVISSFLFTLFAALMIIPLYIGVNNLAGKRTAELMIIIFSLLPFFINYSNFLWNPNFQFVLLPILVWLMGRLRQNSTRLNFFWLFL